MGFLVSLLINAGAIFITAYILPGVEVDSVVTAVVAAVVMGVINAFVKPVLVLLTLPITVLTLGLFALVLNALLVLLVSVIVPGFAVDGFWWALAFSIVLALVNGFLHQIQSRI
jgi:putative membrane protein